MTQSDVSSITAPEGDIGELATAIDTLRETLNVSYRLLADRVGIDHARLYRMLRHHQGLSYYVLGQSMTHLGRIVSERQS